MISILMIIFLVFVSNAHAGTMPELTGDVQSLARAVALVDKDCLQLKENGPCAIGEIPGVWISYYEPSLVMRTVSPHSSWNAGNSGNLQFHEVHIYDFPLKQFEEAALCLTVTGSTSGPRYLSEFDQPQWRRETGSGNFIGNWGPLYPRTGFVVHYSQSVSSALIALRGISAARVMSGHKAQAPLLFGINKLQDKMQMVEPNRQMCMPLGMDPRMWLGSGRVGAQGEYLWIYWRFMQCCKTAAPIPSSL